MGNQLTWQLFRVDTKTGFSLNFSSAGKGPFMAGKAKNAPEARFLRGSGGGG